MSLITSLFTVSSGTSRTWCRPAHRTNCAYVAGGNACCICIPSSATCFVIEMWGQGGGGAASCCCMGSPNGGMGGDYGWVTCTTSATSHTFCICACACTCFTPTAGAVTGSPGQLARVCDCGSSGITCWVVNTTSAIGGTTVCQCAYSSGGAVNGYNNINFNPYHSTLAINCCWWGFGSNNFGMDQACLFGTGASSNNPFRQDNYQPFQLVQGTSNLIPGTANTISCSCCTNFNFYVRGGCGFTAPDQQVVYAYDNACFLVPTASWSGAGYGRGGAAYAGGAAQCCDCSSQAGCQFGGTQGNTPGGGGSSASGTGVSGGCCLGGAGGTSLVLISWS